MSITTVPFSGLFVSVLVIHNHSVVFLTIENIETPRGQGRKCFIDLLILSVLSRPGRQVHSSEQLHLPAFLRSGHPLPEPLPSTTTPSSESKKQRNDLLFVFTSHTTPLITTFDGCWLISQIF